MSVGNSLSHVFTSTLPVGNRSCFCWNALTAARVWGPNIPSSLIPSSRWSSATAVLESPYSSSTRSAWLCWSLWAILPASSVDRSDATAVTLGHIGEAATAAVTATDAVFLRVWSFLASAANTRRRCERKSESCHSSADARSRSAVPGTGTSYVADRLRGELTGSRLDLRYATHRWQFAPWPMLRPIWVPRSPSQGDEDSAYMPRNKIAAFAAESQAPPHNGRQLTDPGGVFELTGWAGLSPRRRRRGPPAWPRGRPG